MLPTIYTLHFSKLYEKFPQSRALKNECNLGYGIIVCKFEDLLNLSAVLILLKVFWLKNA